VFILDLSDSSDRSYSEAELDLYDEGLKILSPERQGIEGRAICKMRADAVKAAPEDEQLALACFRACLKRDSLEYAQQVMLTLVFYLSRSCRLVLLEALLRQLRATFAPCTTISLIWANS
jgi:hypothetical protein